MVLITRLHKRNLTRDQNLHLPETVTKDVQTFSSKRTPPSPLLISQQGLNITLPEIVGAVNDLIFLLEAWLWRISFSTNHRTGAQSR